MTEDIARLFGIGFLAGFMTGVITSAVGRLADRVRKIEEKDG